MPTVTLDDFTVAINASEEEEPRARRTGVHLWSRALVARLAEGASIPVLSSRAYQALGRYG